MRIEGYRLAGGPFDDSVQVVVVWYRADPRAVEGHVYDALLDLSTTIGADFHTATLANPVLGVRFDHRSALARAVLYHDRWSEQEQHGGTFVAILRYDEFLRQMEVAIRRALAKRSALADVIAKYERPPTAPFEQLPNSIQKKIARRKNGCWIWRGGVDGNGYGNIPAKQGGTTSAHRRVYEWLVGPIPDGAVLRHSCDTRRCVNPDHLTPGTPQENADDMVSRGRNRHVGSR